MIYAEFILYTLSKAVMYLYGLLIYPLAYPLRGLIRKNKKLMFLLWLVLDDESDFGEDFFLNGRKKNFITSYLWAAVRNSCWNYHSLFVYDLVVPNQERFPNKRLKWEYYTVEEGWVSGWTVNKGDRLSEYYTTLGEDSRVMKLPYRNKKGMKKIFTYSYAGKVGMFLINIKLGFNDLGQQILEFKIKLYRKKHTNHWINPLHK